MNISDEQFQRLVALWQEAGVLERSPKVFLRLLEMMGVPQDDPRDRILLYSSNRSRINDRGRVIERPMGLFIPIVPGVVYFMGIDDWEFLTGLAVRDLDDYHVRCFDPWGPWLLIFSTIRSNELMRQRFPGVVAMMHWNENRDSGGYAAISTERWSTLEPWLEKWLPKEKTKG